VHAPDDLELPGGSPAAGPSREKAPAAGLLDEVIAAAQRPAAGPGAFRLDDFLTDPVPGASLRRWFRVAPSARFNYSRDEVLDRLNLDIAELDIQLTEQLNAILHHPSFQKLEASWRGLHYLTDKAAGQRDIKLRVLNLSWHELSRDLDRAIEFDQSQFFSKIYSEEFGSPGGEPFGVILGDYEVSHRIRPDHPNDIDALESLAHVAAAAFAPMIMGAHPSLFGLDDFAALGSPLNLPRTFQQLEYLRWHRIRDTEDTRFIGLVLPRVLMRVPYQDEELRPAGFRFSEQVAGPDNRNYLWGSAVYALGAVLVREFAQSGWLAAIQGVERGVEAGGLVTGLPQHDFGTDAENLVLKYSTDVMITDREEKELGELGFMPLCVCKDTPWSAFYGSASVQKPKMYDEVPATVNARLSAMLQYMFCVSRFAHYLKVIGRDRVGSFATAQECQNYLQRWLLNYTIAADDASMQAKAKAPLREGRVEVREQPGKPGSYYCVMHLRPHFQLDQVVTAVRLVTDLSPGNYRR
jgi:type VI secretion system protein ImpD